MSTQGRAASARIVASLQASLEGGAWLSTADLAKRAGCTDRAVRNYLAEAEQALGFAVERSAAAGGRVRYRKAAAHSATIEQVGLLLGKEMLKNFFPVDGTSLARRSPAGHAEIVIAVRGAAVYEAKHKSALRRWLALAEARPRRALVFDYRATDGRSAPRFVWPIGLLVRDLAQVYLVGVPVDAERPTDTRTYLLSRVQALPRVVPPAEAGEPPPWVDSASVRDVTDLPFSVVPPTHDPVNVDVTLSASQAEYLLGRVWHTDQRLTRRPDGALRVRFGPVDRGEAEAWVRTWGESVVSGGVVAAAKANRRS